MVAIITNDPFCLNAPEPAHLASPTYDGDDKFSESGTESPWSNSTMYSPTSSETFSPQEQRMQTPPPYVPEENHQRQSWLSWLSHAFQYYTAAPVVLYNSQRAQVWIGLVTLVIGTYYYYGDYHQGAAELVLARKAYESSMWKDCHDRPDLANSTTCSQYLGLSFDSVVTKRNLITLMIDPPSQSDTLPAPSCSTFNPTQPLCYLFTLSRTSYYLLKCLTLCLLIYTYATKMTPISPSSRSHRLSESVTYTILITISLSFLLGCSPLLSSQGLIRPKYASQWQFVLKGTACFHFGFAWYRLLSSRRSPLPLLRGAWPWRDATLLCMATDLVLFAFTACLFAHVISSALHADNGVNSQTLIKGLLVIHMPLLTILYATVKALGTRAFDGGPEKGRTSFCEEAQEERCTVRLCQSPLVESIGGMVGWAMGRRGLEGRRHVKVE